MGSVDLAVRRRQFTPTSRQLQVLRATCLTGSRKEAAATLGISVHTVRSHLSKLHLGMGFHNDSQACFALAQQLRELPE